jgi:alpha-beta hydrolase superfamily lysophospholipase
MLTIVAAAAIEAICRAASAGSYRLIEAARYEILQAKDGYRAQLWAAFDAFVRRRLKRASTNKALAGCRRLDGILICQGR